MRKFGVHLFAILLAVAPALEPVFAQSMPMSTDTTCGLNQPAFCDTFDQPYTGGGRTGALDPNHWSVARVSGATSPGRGIADRWMPSQVMHCKTPMTGIMPPQDYFMCGPEFGESMHFMEAFNDGDSYVFNDAQMRQPFDFANRTGTIAFEVDAKTAAGHSWWVELWVTDQPVPAPHVDSAVAYPQNAIGIAFYNTCNTRAPEGSDIGSPKAAPGEVDIVNNFNVERIAPWGDAVNGTLFRNSDCYTTMPDMRNHFKVLINQSRIEVWSTDAMGTILKPISVVSGLNLNFTRGYVHLEHVQYNAAKSSVTPYQTYHWDNVGFDGPKLPIPAQYSVQDSMTPGENGSVNLGYVVRPTGLQNGPLTLTGVNLTGASGAMLSFDEWFLGGKSIKYRLNSGPWHTWTGLRPDWAGAMWRAGVAPVDLSELQNGTNTLDFASADDELNAVANIDLRLPDAASAGALQPAQPQPQEAPAPAPEPAAVPAPLPTMTMPMDGSGGMTMPMDPGMTMPTPDDSNP